MQKYKKIIVKLILTFILIYALTPNLFARIDASAGGGGGSGTSSTTGDIVDSAHGFLETGKGESSPISEEALKKGSSTLYNVLLIIGIGVALIWGTILGIQFVTGSLEEKANIKNGLTAYIFGCVIIFGAFGIWKLVLSLLEDFA